MSATRSWHGPAACMAAIAMSGCISAIHAGRNADGKHPKASASTVVLGVVGDAVVAAPIGLYVGSPEAFLVPWLILTVVDAAYYGVTVSK